MRTKSTIFSLLLCASVSVSGCVLVDPYAKWESPKTEKEVPTSDEVTLLYAIAYAHNARDAYREKLSDHAILTNSAAPALITLSAITLGLAAYGAHQAKAKALALLADVELQGRSDTFPDRLSGGEQQRIAVARALMLDPPVLLADEPTGNLDSETGQRVLELLWRLTTARATTLVIATHSPEVAERAARRIELRDGGVLSDSAPHPPPTPATSAAAPPRPFKGRHP